MLVSSLLYSALFVLLLQCVGFVLATKFGKNSIADIFWGIGFVVISIVNIYINGVTSPRHILVFLLIIMWATRLSIHIFLRNVGKSEDFRYKQWKENWGKWWIVRSFLQVFMLQGLLMVLVAAPAIAIFNLSRGPLTILDSIGALVWSIGFYFETVGDWELMKFKRDPKNKGRILKTGLWSLSRHPNYFGESTMWWGIFILSIATGAYWAIVGPAFITYSLLKVSGVSLLEKKYSGNKEYIEYQKNTRAFIPLPKKS